MLALAMVALVLTFCLVREHWNHSAGRWIYLLPLACPLLHLLMHGGHGGHRAGDNVDAVTPPRQ